VLAGVLAGDTVSLSTNGYAATFASAGVGNGIVVTVSGLALTGVSATNYTLLQPVGLTANITPKALTINSVPSPVINSVGLTNNIATVAWNSVTGGVYRVQYIDNLSGTNWNDLSPDVMATGLTAIQTNVVTGVSQRFYRIRVLNPGITANNKVYDGTTVATITSNNVVLAGVVAGDTVTLSTNSYTASFASANVGNGIVVTVSGLTLTGASATNYTLTPPTGLTANITPATLLVNAANKNRTYGLPNPPLTVTYSGFVSGEGTNVLTGAPNLSTSATTNSPSGSYAIMASLGTLSAVNYNFVVNGETLNVVELPWLSSVALNENEFAFSWPTIANQTYQLQYTDNLAATTWVFLGDPLVGTGNPIIVTNRPGASPQRFFRVAISS
jgi:trimeric autotransporter adhesin